MPAGDPVLGSSRRHRQLLGNDLKYSDMSSGHARDCSPTPGQHAPGDRRSGLALRAPPSRGPPEPQPQANRVSPMSRLMRDSSPGTYVVNPDTSSGISPIAASNAVIRRHG